MASGRGLSHFPEVVLERLSRVLLMAVDELGCHAFEEVRSVLGAEKA